MKMVDNLKRYFKKAREDNTKYFAVAIKFSVVEKVEIIINPRENWDNKEEYYATVYDEDLRLKGCPDKIKIVGFAYGNSFKEIEEVLMLREFEVENNE